MATTEMKRQLKALAHARGMSGEVSKIVRNILVNVVPDLVSKMKPKERETYDQVLENLKITDDFTAQILEDGGGRT